MRTLALSRHAASIVAVALLADCGGLQPPIGAPGAMPQDRTIATYAERAGSWMLPEARLRLHESADLLFVNATCVSKPFSGMCIFSFPSGRYIGWIELGNVVRIDEMCPGRRGHVFMIGVYSSEYAIIEYDHNGNGPIKVISDPAYQSLGCAVDDASGSLAVANPSTSGVQGSLSIFSAGASYPVIYKSRYLYSDMFCTYDAKGNLFVDGTDRAGKFQLAELARGASTLKTVTVNKTILSAGPIQWDGHSLALGYGDATHALIFQMTVSGSKAIVTGSTRLKAPRNERTQFGLFWIERARLVASFDDSGVYPIGVWKYPAGGDPTDVIRRGANSREQRVMTVSLAPH